MLAVRGIDLSWDLIKTILPVIPLESRLKSVLDLGGTQRPVAHYLVSI
jgi:hypothetical protein